MVMRKLVVFLVILSTAFATCQDYVNANCQDYVNSAVTEFGVSCVYPQCFGAAARYKEAAFCYSCHGEKATADTYFQKAAQYYLQGKDYMGPAGDYPLTAPSYEYAADMYVELGNPSQASIYYDSAINEYLKIDDQANATAVRAKKAALWQTPPTNTTGQAGLSQNFIIGGIAVIVIIAIAIFIYFRKPAKAAPSPQPPDDEYPDLDLGEPEQPREAQDKSLKEKMRDRIRKKYGLE